MNVQNKKNTAKSYEERAKEYLERNIKLLETGGKDARVIIANTIESKELLSKFITVDSISKKAREQVGGSFSIEKFTELNQKFTEINKLMNEVIYLGTKEDLYFDARTKKFSYHEDNINKLITEGKTPSEISKEIKIDESKVTSWIKIIDSKKVDKTEVKADTKLKTAKKTSTEEKSSKNEDEKKAS